MTDFELLAAWRAGDREAGQELARNHYKAVRQFVSGKVDDETAKEIAQQTFLTLCQRKDEFEGFSQFRTFLLGIARFKVIEHYRRQRMYGEHFDPLEHSVVDPNLERTLSTVFAAHEHERIVVQALRSLPLDDQFLLELKAHAGLKNRELAEVFRVTIGSIAGRINRARERLAKAIATLSDDPELKADGSLESWVSSVCAKLPNELREP